METKIPFQGFYESVHDYAIDMAIENIAGDDAGHLDDKTFDKVYLNTDFKKVHETYAKKFCEAFANEIEVKLEFKELISPKEYNFTTDSIVAEIPESEVLRLWSLVNRDSLQERIKEVFTSRSGFISFYANDLDRWPENVLEWDLNQVGTLIDVYAKDNQNWDDDKEMYLLDNTDFLYDLINY